MGKQANYLSSHHTTSWKGHNLANGTAMPAAQVLMGPFIRIRNAMGKRPIMLLILKYAPKSCQQKDKHQCLQGRDSTT
jgi:hypothetical protein